MNLFLVAIKLGMTRLFSTEGKTIPITLLKVYNNYIDYFKDNKGFKRLHLSCILKKKIKFTNCFINYYTKCIKQKTTNFIINSYNYYIFNKIIPISIFYINQSIDVTSFSIGKGFSGVIKRHNFRSGRSTHGNSKAHNLPGSIGMNQDPGRVFPGKKLPGQLGNKKHTIQNLKIKKIDFDYNIIYIKGCISGYKNSIVIIAPSKK